MDRREFFSAALVPLLPVPAPAKELVLDYHSKDPALYRTIVCIPSDKPTPDYLDHLRGWEMLLEAKHAWLLPDGRIEVERYCITKGVDGQGRTTFTIKEAQLLTGGWAPATETLFLDKWRLVTVDSMGHTVRERYSQRT